MRWLFAIVAPIFTINAISADELDYLKQVKPLLASRCASCHGALKQKARLRLDTAAFIKKGGRSGPAIIPGNSSKSLLLHRALGRDGHRMPPEKAGVALSPEQIAILKKWIDTGAKAPNDEPTPLDPRKHWAFRPLERPKVPIVRNLVWSKNPLDAFIAKQHEKYRLTPQPEASRVVLLRRLYLDLIGLPPSAEDIATFQNDNSPGWYQRVVERLLHDPRHGERWARQWMDIWRYSDWSGFSGQLRFSQKHIWHWRDWIVESLNADMPYDEMVRLMLAADELYPTDLGKLRATGYLARNWVLFNRNQWLDNVVEHVGKGFLGLTMNCAKCHDHKYDPIAQRDYYAMRAFFEPYHVRLDVVPGQPDLAINGIPRVYDGLLEVPTYLFKQGDEKRPDKSARIAPGVPELLAFEKLKIKRVTLPIEVWQPERRPWVMEAHLAAARAKLRAAQAKITSNTATPAKLKVAKAVVGVARAELTSLERRADALRVAWRRKEPYTGYVRDGAPKVEKEKIRAAIQTERQVAVAKARKVVAEAELARLRAARQKKQVMEANLNKAQKLLKEAQKRAEAPIGGSDRHTLLIGAKWTPTRFRRSTGDDPTVKFAPHSTGRRTALAQWITDPRNPLTARVAANHIWTRHMGTPLVASVFDFGLNGKRPSHPELLDWLASELVDSGWSMKHLHRLIVTSATYRMNSSVAGAKANVTKDIDNLRWWRRNPIRMESQVVRDSILAHAGTLEPKMGGPSVPAKQQTASKRRGLYFFHSANDRNRFLATFDEAMVKECYCREQSILPQQALALTNSKFVLEAAPRIAKRLGTKNLKDATFVRKAFTVLLGITANEAEVSASVQALERWRQLANGNSDRARGHFVWALINHNDFVTLR